MVKEERGVYQAKTTAARADIIAHETKRTITENMDKDPAFYEKFSKLIQDAIDGFKNQRISDLEYLQKASAIRDESPTHNATMSPTLSATTRRPARILGRSNLV